MATSIPLKENDHFPGIAVPERMQKAFAVSR